MDLREALKNGEVIEVEPDLYLTESGRELRYDRSFRKPRSARYCCMWVDERGNVFRNFCDALHKLNAYRWCPEDRYI